MQASGDGVQRQEHLRHEGIRFLALPVRQLLSPILEQGNLLFVEEIDRGLAEHDNLE